MRARPLPVAEWRAGEPAVQAWAGGSSCRIRRGGCGRAGPWECSPLVPADVHVGSHRTLEPRWSFSGFLAASAGAPIRSIDQGGADRRRTAGVNSIPATRRGSRLPAGGLPPGGDQPPCVVLEQLTQCGVLLRVDLRVGVALAADVGRVSGVERAEMEAAQWATVDDEAPVDQVEVALVHVPAGDVDPGIAGDLRVEVTDREIEPALVQIAAGHGRIPVRGFTCASGRPPVDEVPAVAAHRQEAAVELAELQQRVVIGHARIGPRRQRVRRQHDRAWRA